MVNKLQLKTHKHHSPYSIKGIKNVWETNITEQCHISFSIEWYKDEVTCDVVGMNACHMLLKRLWQFDLNTIRYGKNNTYRFYKDNIKVILAPMKSRVKRTYLLIPMKEDMMFEDSKDAQDVLDKQE